MNDYITPMDKGSNLVFHPYEDGLKNFKKLTNEKISIGNRFLHLLAGISLWFPFVNIVSYLALRTFASKPEIPSKTLHGRVDNSLGRSNSKM